MWTRRFISSVYRLWQAPAPPRPPPPPPPNPSPPPPKHDPSRPPDYARSLPPPAADRVPSRSPEHVLSPPPQRAPSPLVDVQAQGPPPPPWRWRPPVDVPESPPNNHDDVPGCPLPPRPILPLPPSDDDGDDDDEDRRRGLRRRLDFLNEDAQQCARGKRSRNITHTNTHWTKKRTCLNLLVEQIYCKFRVLMLLLVCSWFKFFLKVKVYFFARVV